MKLKRLMTYITEEQHEKLRKLSYEKNGTIAELVRHAVDNYLKKSEGDNMMLEKMKELVRENMRQDGNATLLGFLKVENNVSPRGHVEGFFKEGEVLVYYEANNGEIHCEPLRDMINVIIDGHKDAIDDITEGERFVDEQTLKKLEDAPYLWVENCGASECGTGILYTIYLLDDNGDKIDIKLGEVVAI